MNFIRSRKQQILIILVFIGLGILMYIKDKAGLTLEYVDRGEAGSGSYETTVEYELEGDTKKREIKLQVPDRQLTNKEQDKYLKKAYKEAKKNFLANNKDLDHLTEKVIMAESYQDGLVKAYWTVERLYKPDIEFGEEIIDSSGNIDDSLVDEKGTELEFIVQLECQNKTLIKTFTGRVYPRDRDDIEKVQWQLEKNIQSLLNKDRQKNSVKLPKTTDGRSIKWKKPQSRTYLLMIFLGIITAVAIEFKAKEDGVKQLKRRKEQLQIDYPDFVSKIALLLGTGMTMDAVWKRIGENYKLQRENKSQTKREVYEELWISLRQLEEGTGEVKVYEEFGDRCDLPEYRRLSSYISQNLRKGTRELTAILENEAETAMEKRRSLVRKYGEEAGTKMLFPMMIMLGVVIAIIIIPAFNQF